MTQRADYFIQVLETIGTPLMSAVLTKHSGNAEDTATHVAQLLTKTVQSSIQLGPLIELDTLGEKTDPARVALAGLSSQLIAELYKAGDSAPEEEDLRRAEAGLKSIITFAKNFEASQDSELRLASIKPTGQIVDKTQSDIQILAGFMPVVTSVSKFSFGIEAPELIKQIADKLTAKASGLRDAQFGNETDGDTKTRIERGLLGCLASLYVASHDNIALSADAAQKTIDDVWTHFDTQVSVLEALIQTIVPGGKPVEIPTATDTKAPAPPAAPVTPPAAPPVAEEAAPPAAQEAPPIPPPVEQKPPADTNKPAIFGAKKPESPPAEEAAPPASPATPPVTPAETPPAATQAPSGNPMSFFSGDKGDANDTPAAPTAPPEPPPAEEAAPPTTPPPVPDTPAETPPPAEESNPSTDEEKPSGNPMAFFKKDDED